MTNERTTNRLLSPNARRLIRSYGLLIAIALAFLILALFVREEERTVPAESMPAESVRAVAGVPA
jgi:hypothetical protein